MPRGWSTSSVDYRSIVIPLGLFQVLRDFDRFKPDSDEFDLVRVIEYCGVAAALSVRPRSGIGQRTGSVHRHSQCHGQPRSERLPRLQAGQPARRRRSRQPDAGAGPSASLETRAVRSRASMWAPGRICRCARPPTIDQRVVDILASETALRFAEHATTRSAATSQGQIAMAITGGYRGALCDRRGARSAMASTSRPTTTTFTAFATRMPTPLSGSIPTPPAC